MCGGSAVRCGVGACVAAATAVGVCLAACLTWRYGCGPCQTLAVVHLTSNGSPGFALGFTLASSSQVEGKCYSCCCRSCAP